MKRGATKEEIIRITQELITRNGIRAVRVDEIAQTLGISKRTLYEMFADKEDLVSACLDFTAGAHHGLQETPQQEFAATSLQAGIRIHRTPVYGRKQFSVRPAPQGGLRGTFRRTPGILAQRTGRPPARKPGRKAPVARNRCREFRRPDSGNDLRNADKQRDARGVLPLLQDDPARCGNPRRGRADRQPPIIIL